MSIKIFKNKNTIGFLLSGNLNGNDFIHVIHDIELICAEQESVHVLFETEDIKTHDFKLNMQDFDLYRKYRDKVKMIAVVHEENEAPFIMEKFRAFKQTQFKIFGKQKIKEALNWISK